MRTGLFLLAGFLLLGATLNMARLFSHDYPSAATNATAIFCAAWLALTGLNLYTGVTKAGSSVGAELPIFLLLFGVPVAAALLLRWKGL